MAETNGGNRASALIVELLRRRDAGEVIDEQAVLASHPELAQELREFFADERQIQGLIERVPESEASLETSRPGVDDSVPSGVKKFDQLPVEFGRYRVHEVLGQGAMGAVYRAHDTRLGRDVALKTPKLDATADPELIERFEREARAAAALHHRNICPVFDVGEIEGVRFLTMAHIDGRPLSDLISEDKLLPEKQAANLVRKLAVALHQAHQAGVIHRDLKPANVMIDRDREPIVMDFGLARYGETVDQSRLTAVGTLMGSPAYMSPEQVSGDPQAVGLESDIYSLGVVLFELLTGKLPYEGGVAAMIGQIIAAPVPAVCEFRSDCDKALEAICLKMMAKEKADRFATMKEVAEELGRFLKRSQQGAGTDTRSKPHQDAVASLEKNAAAETSADSHAPRARQTKTRPRAGRFQIKHIALAVGGIAGLAVLAGVIIHFSNGTRVEIEDGTEATVQRESSGQTETITVSVSKNGPGQGNESDSSISSVSPASGEPYEILTSPEWEWSDPVFIGDFDTASHLDTTLTDDFVVWLESTRHLPSVMSDPKVKNDIWMLTREPGDPSWGDPIHLGDAINHPKYEDGGATLSPDGRLLVFSSDRPGGYGGGDLWMSERDGTDQPWSEAVNMGSDFNSRGWDWAPKLSPDGLELYFASTDLRDGNGDLWVSRRAGRDDGWPRPVNLGSAVNSSYQEFNAAISSDGRVLFFISKDRPGGQGEFDIWMSTRDAPGGAWSQAVCVPAPVNTAGHEFPCAVSADGSLLLFRRIPEGGQEAPGHGYWSTRRVRRGVTPETNSQDADDTGWVDLFNGRDLTGWRYAHSKRSAQPTNETWIVDQSRGVLSESGDNKNWIETDQVFRDFELKLDFRLLKQDLDSQEAGGVLVWSNGMHRQGQWADLDPIGVEIDLWRRNAVPPDERMGTGCLITYGVSFEHEHGSFPDPAAGNFQRNVGRLRDPQQHADGEWNSARLVCEAGTLRVWINETLVNEVRNSDVVSGRLCLRGGKAPIEYRNIRVRALIAASGTSQVVAESSTNTDSTPLPSPHENGSPLKNSGSAAASSESASDETASPKQALDEVQLTGTLTGHQEWIRDLEFSFDGQRLVSCSFDKTVRVWELSSGRELHSVSTPTRCTALALSPDDRQAVAVGQGQIISVVDLANGTLLRKLSPGGTRNGRSYEGVAWSPDGSHIAAACLDKSGRIWRADSGRLIHTFPIIAPSNGPCEIHYTADGKRLVIAPQGKPGRVQVLDATDGSEEMQIPINGGASSADLAIAPDSTRFVSGTWNGSMIVGDLAQGKTTSVIQVAGGSRTSVKVCWSPDGSWIACGHPNGTVYLVDGTTLRVAQQISQGRKPTALAFSKDSRKLAAAFSGNATSALEILVFTIPAP